MPIQPLTDPAKMKVIATVARLLHDLIKNLQLIDGTQTALQHEKSGTNEHQLLTLDQIMELIPVSRATLHRMEKAGRFPAAKQIGPHRRAWRARDVYAWIEENEPQPRRAYRMGSKKKRKAAAKNAKKKASSKKK